MHTRIFVSFFEDALRSSLWVMGICGFVGFYLFLNIWILFKNQEYKSFFGNGNHHGIIHNLIEDHLQGLENKENWIKEPHVGGPNLIEISIKTFDDEAKKVFLLKSDVILIFLFIF